MSGAWIGFLSTLLGAVSVYAAILLAAAFIPQIQDFFIYVNVVNFPLFAKYQSPEKYGFYPRSWRSFFIATPDGWRIGATQMLPVSVARSHLQEPLDHAFDDILATNDRPTFLYLHGNAANRLAPNRRNFAQMTTGRIDANHLAIDYRGYGDSNGRPSEPGLVVDARAAWDWLVSKGAQPANICIVGASLGTGVATSLAHQLTTEGIHPRALVLIAPYSSITRLLDTYMIFKCLPLTAPLRFVPRLQRLLFRSLRTQFKSDTRIAAVHCPILLLHARDDADIPSSHSQALFDRAVADDADNMTLMRLGDQGSIQRSTRASKGKVVFGHLEFGGCVLDKQGMQHLLQGRHDTLHNSELTLELIEEIIQQQ